MIDILKQIQNSSFKKEGEESSFKMHLDTLYGILNIKISLEDDNSLFVLICHNDITQAMYAISTPLSSESKLDDIINDAIKSFFNEIANKYITRFSVY